MVNLIQVQNDLKNLSDEELQRQTQVPSGEMPPFMVLAETNRRKSMRDSYAGEQARLQENRTTVMEDLTGNPPPPQGVPPAGAAPPAGGLPAPPPQAGGLPVPGFANGGMVGTPYGDYPDYQSGLAAMAQQQTAERANMKSAALLNAGLRIMGGTSPYAAQNIGLAAPAVSEYQQSVRQGAQDQLGLMKAGAAHEAGLRGEALRQMEFDFRRGQAARSASQAERRMDISEAAGRRLPSDVQSYKYRATLSPEEREQFDAYKAAGTPGTREQKAYKDAVKAYDSASDEARKQLEGEYTFNKTPQEKMAAEQKVAALTSQIFFEKNPRLAALYGKEFGLAPASQGTAATSPYNLVGKPPGAGSDMRNLYDPLLYGND